MQYTILITIDVEDWFQVENFRPWIPFDTWDQRELRVEQNTHRLLNLFDSVGSAGKLEAIGQKANRIKSYEARMLEGSEDFKLPSLPASQLQAFCYEIILSCLIEWQQEGDLLNDRHGIQAKDPGPHVGSDGVNWIRAGLVLFGF